MRNKFLFITVLFFFQSMHLSGEILTSIPLTKNQLSHDGLTLRERSLLRRISVKSFLGATQAVVELIKGTYLINKIYEPAFYGPKLASFRDGMAIPKLVVSLSSLTTAIASLQTGSRTLAKANAVLSILDGAAIATHAGMTLYAVSNLEENPPFLQKPIFNFKLGQYAMGAAGAGVGVSQIYDGIQLAKNAWRKEIRNSMD